MIIIKRLAHARCYHYIWSSTRNAAMSQRTRVVQNKSVMSFFTGTGYHIQNNRTQPRFAKSWVIYSNLNTLPEYFVRPNL